MSRAIGGAPPLNENAVLDDRPRARQQKPSLIDAQRQSTSKKLLAFNNQCDDHQHAATPPPILIVAKPSSRLSRYSEKP
jgi:hypothetical protein